MRIVRFQNEAGLMLGVLDSDGEAIQPVANADVLQLALGEAAPIPLGPAFDFRSAELAAPVTPASVRDFMTFEQHVEGTSRLMHDGGGTPEAWFEAPAFYFSSPHAITGPFDEVAVPPGCAVFDYELEVGAVIGRAGRDLTPEQARDYIAGYVLLNDWSGRDIAMREMRMGLGPVKGKDSAVTLGPYLATSDELDPYRKDGFLDLQMEVAVNDHLLGRDTLANMAWSFEELVAYASRGTWVMPGDILGSGTCGTGCLVELWARYGREIHPPLRPGDAVRMTVEGLGEIRNTIVPGTDPVPIAEARKRNYEPLRPTGVG